MTTRRDILSYKGCNYFRQRLVLSVLSTKPIRITDIRAQDDEPGLREFEVNLIRLIDKITNGTVIELNETGTSIYFQPGLLHGGALEHECSTQRAIGTADCYHPTIKINSNSTRQVTIWRPFACWRCFVSSQSTRASKASHRTTSTRPWTW